VRFAKYHGTGNDFVMVEDLGDELRLDPATIAALCDRHRGVGADGLIRIAPADDADFFMDYYNADGEAAEMCGNGIRCLAKYAYDRGLTSATEIDVLTRAGMKRLSIEAGDGVARAVTVDMGPPAFDLGSIPMRGDPTSRFVGQPFDLDGRTVTATAVSMGNPHLVVFLEPEEDPASVDVRRLGPMVESLPLFPNRTNVEFVRVRDGVVWVRVWERGSGETMACGTGACASLVASAVAGLTPREAPVEFPGGRLRVEWRDDDHVALTGPATFVFEGEVDAGWLGAAGAGAASAAAEASVAGR
jgi:diaminopimelate epimerase